MAPPTEISDIFLIVRFPQHVILTLCLLSALSIPTMSTSSVDDEGPPEGTLDSNFLQEQLERILSALMTPAIDGVYAVVEATNVRRNRYLEQQSGDVESAVSAAIQYNSNMGKLKTLLISLVPGVGIPGSVLVPVWNQIRTAALVASLYGFDVSEPEVQCDILLCLVESDVRKTGKKVMSEVGRRVAHELVKKVTSKVTARLVSRLIPFGVIYDALTDSTSSAGKHAQKYFRAQASTREGSLMIERAQRASLNAEERLDLLSKAQKLFELGENPELISKVEKLQQEIREFGGDVKAQIPGFSAFGLLQAFVDLVFSVVHSILQLVLLALKAIYWLFAGSSGSDDGKDL